MIEREIELRPPRPADVEGFAELHARVWRATYRGLMPDEVVDGLSAEAFRPVWESVTAAYAAGTVPADGRGFLVALAGAEPLGFCMHGPARDEDAPCSHQVWSLNVAPERHGTGLADQLLTASIGDRAAYLWVAQGNARAVGFYERHGFRRDGVVETEGAHGVAEMRMVRGDRSGTEADEGGAG